MSGMPMYMQSFLNDEHELKVTTLPDNPDQFVLTFNFYGRSSMSVHMDYNNLVRLVGVLKDALVTSSPVSTVDDAVIAHLRETVREGASGVSVSSGIPA